MSEEWYVVIKPPPPPMRRQYRAGELAAGAVSAPGNWYTVTLEIALPVPAHLVDGLVLELQRFYPEWDVSKVDQAGFDQLCVELRLLDA